MSNSIENLRNIGQRERKRSGYGKRKENSTETKSNNPIAPPTSDLESDTSNGNMAKEKITQFHSPVSIHIHSKRKRLVDIDGISAKAIIDGIVHTGLLEDDSPTFVKEVSYSQEKSGDAEEETIVTIKEI